MGHLSLEVSDLDRSVPFYDRFLGRIGFRRSSRAPEHAVYQSPSMALWLLRGAPPRVSRTPPSGREAVLAEHLAFKVESPQRLRQIERALEREGVYPIFLGEERPELQKGYVASTWLDPDGFALELFATEIAPPRAASERRPSRRVGRAGARGSGRRARRR
ncbi:MAG TPA: VOC family protein [Thermoplasmata archaeon]|nr:VOC family protein [Thermoplasmata archaeon]